MTLHKLLALVYAKLEVMNKNKARKRLRQAGALHRLACEASEKANAEFHLHKLRLTEKADEAYFNTVKDVAEENKHARQLELQAESLRDKAQQRLDSADVHHIARCRAIDNETLKGKA